MNFGKSPPVSRVSSPEDSVSAFVYTAEDYKNRQRKLRLDFIDRHFKQEFINLFRTLAKKSSEGKVCREELVLNIDEDLDKDSVVAKVSLFLSDYGYSVHVEPDKDFGRKVRLTIAI